MRVTLFCGSTSSNSANRALLDASAAALRRRGHDVDDAGSVTDIPGFQPALVDSAPLPVTRLRQRFEASDAVIIAVPEYGGGAAGWAKNALDWMVGSGSLYRRAAVVMSAGTTGGAFAIEQITRTLTWQGAFVVATLGVAAARTKVDDSGRFVDPATLEAIDTVVERVVVAAGADGEARSRLANEVLAPFGIDLNDRRSR